MSDRPKQELVVEALSMALGRRRPAPGLLQMSIIELIPFSFKAGLRSLGLGVDFVREDSNVRREL